MSAPVEAPRQDGSDVAEGKAALLMRLRAVGVRSMAVLRVMETVPREAFVDPRHAVHAYRDIALPIGCGQTTAEPSFIARQLEALSLTADCRVLEVGSGSGYVTALLAQLAGAVRGVERYRSLAEPAQARASALSRAPVPVGWADGLETVPDEPFDRVLLHVAVPAPPAGLLDRLGPGGVMVCPLIAVDGRQALVRFAREAEGTITATRLCASRLSPALNGRSRAL